MLPLREQTQTAERAELRWQGDWALRKSHLIADWIVIDEEVITLGHQHHSIWSRVDLMCMFSDKCCPLCDHYLSSQKDSPEFRRSHLLSALEILVFYFHTDSKISSLGIKPLYFNVIFCNIQVYDNDYQDHVELCHYYIC